VTLLTELEGFYTDHRLWGELKAGVDGDGAGRFPTLHSRWKGSEADLIAMTTHGRSAPP
jgi:hypothetical protein